MYHSHHDAQVQVPNGMLGIFQIGDPALPPNTGPVTQVVPMVLNDAGVIGLSLNGKSFPATAPVIAHVGDWVEINYFNEGLQIHPMHLHGLPQLVIGEDGYPLASPYTRRHAVDRARSALHDAGARDVRLPRPEQHARHLGVPLPHPHARRRPERHVRHGHHVHRHARPIDPPRFRKRLPGRNQSMSTTATRTPKLPPPWFMHTFWRVHRALCRLSGGRFLWTTSSKRGWGALRLTTVGRKSGQERSVIVGYLEEGPNLVTLAMNGYDEGHPSWWLNLEAHPDAVVRLAGQQPRPVRARPAAGEERDRLWQRWVAIDPNHDVYAGRRSTETPVVVLEPRDV